MLSNLDSVKLFFDQAKGKNRAFEKKKEFNDQILSLINLDKKVKKKFDEKNKRIHLLPLDELYELLSEHLLFQRFDGHPQAIRLVARMTMEHTLAALYQVVTSKGFGLGQQHESHPFRSLVGAQEASIKYLNRKDPKAVKLFILVGMAPAGVIDVDLEHLWGKPWQHLAQLLIDRDLIRKKELPPGVDIGQRDDHKYMLLPFMNISAFLSTSENSEQEEQELHRTICKYYVKMMADLFEKLDVELYRSQLQTFRNKLQFYEPNIIESFERTLANQDRKKSKQRGAAPTTGTQRHASRMQSRSSEQDTMQGSFLEKESGDVAKNGGENATYKKINKVMDVLVQKSDILVQEAHRGIDTELLENVNVRTEDARDAKKREESKEREAEQKEKADGQLKVATQSSDRSKLRTPTRIGALGKKNDAAQSKAPLQNVPSTRAAHQSKPATQNGKSRYLGVSS